MNIRFLLTFALWTVAACGQPYTISTVAGANRAMDGAAAVNAPLGSPVSVVVDAAGSVYISDSSEARIRKVSSSGVITTVAGTGIPGFSGDRGRANLAQIDMPGGLALDVNGNLYFADRGNNRVRRISPDGTINTVAGTGTRGHSGDGGPATAAAVRPGYLAFDASGNLYIAESLNFYVRKVDTAGVVTTIAGSGQPGYSGDNALAKDSVLGLVTGLATDARGNVYLSDFSNALVRKIDVTTGLISPFAGSGQYGYIIGNVPATQALLLPTGIVFDSGGLAYIADVNKSRIVRVDTAGILTFYAGNGSDGFGGDGGPAQAAQFSFPSGLALDGSTLYVADEANHRVRKIATGVVGTFAGTGIRDGGPATSAFLSGPDGVAVGTQGMLAVADYGNGAVRRFTLGGAINSVGQVNGFPSGVTFDAAGNLYVSDDEPYVLKITPGGATSIVAGNGKDGFSGDGGAAISAALSGPSGLAVDAAGNLFIADYDNERVRRVAGSNGTISTLAGNGTLRASGDGGPAVNAGVDPMDVALDSRGNLYIADFANDRVRRVAPDGTITTVAGTGKTGYDGDGGPAALALLDGPSGVAVDAAGNLYIADAFNSVVRRVNTAGLITTIAGNGTAMPSSGDGGPALNAQLDPWKLAVDSSGTVFVSDLTNSNVRALTPKAVNPATASITGGNNQSGTVGGALPQMLAVRVLDVSGAPLPGVTVTFAVNPAGAAKLPYPAAVTLADGTARIPVTLGSNVGPFTVTATPGGLPALTFNLTSAAAISPTAPRITSGGIVSAGLSVPAVKSLSPNTIATIFGANFAPAGTARQAGVDDLVDGKVPLQLAGVCVLVGGQKAPVFSVYPSQINFQVPAVGLGPAGVQVVTQCGTPQEEKSGVETMLFQAASPEFFYFAQSADGHNPIAAINAVTGALVGALGSISGVTLVPVKSGDYVTLFATGFGATAPAFGPGELPGAAAQVTGKVSVTVGGIPVDPANVLYAGVTSNAGLYQLNLKLPDGLGDGDQAVMVTIGGAQSPAGAYLNVKN